MLFQTPEFLLLLISVMLAIVLVRNGILQIIILLLASYLFYMSWNPAFICLIIFSTIGVYIAALSIEKCKQKRWRVFWLILSCVVNLGILGFFKYYNFFVDSFNQVFVTLGSKSMLPLLKITLPVGISFYTFQSLGYPIDVFRGIKRAEKSLLRVGLYVAFFPVLLSGPIMRSTGFLPQLDRTVDLRYDNLRSGLNLFLVGLVKKVLIADSLAPVSNQIFNSPKGLPSALIWFGTLAFSLQILCDFSGYTDMARGVARMLGFDVPINFNYPYFARSITDFWRRWHISLSSWFRDYLYIPLGGSRGGNTKTYRNFMVTMGLCGLWHGASWNFILWGCYQGAFLVIERIRMAGKKKKEDFAEKAVSASQMHEGKAGNYPWINGLAPWLFTQYLVFLGWLIFRTSKWDDMIYCIRKYVLFDFNFNVSALGMGGVNPFIAIFTMLAFVILHTFSYRIGGIANQLDRMRWPVRSVVYAATVFALITFWPTGRTAFIYFQF
jgi:alginate O-acetyltransferase complex protein AlgI